jgi:hypothetical protein
MALYPADPNAPPVKSEPRVPSYLPPTIGADLPDIVVPPVDAAQPTSVGVAVADIPARLVSGNGVSVDADGLDFRLGLDIASLQIAEGQPADQWVPVWAVGRPVDEIVRAPVNVLRVDAPSDNTVYGRYNGTWAHLTVAWVDITGKPATFPATPHTHPESEVINLVSDLALKAPLASPALTGTPTAPTATPGDSTTLIATTAFVTAVDILKAPLASPALTGTPTAPTATPGTNTTQLATTAFVAALGALKANLASPVFTGDPQAPTPATADNDTSIATTAFVKAQAYAPLASPALTGTPTAPTATPGDSSTLLATTAFVTAVDILKAPLASPALTGNPTAPTQTPGDSSTKLATTAFVTTADNLKAPLASPALTGTPTAPTPTAGDSTTTLATTAFVTGGITTSAALKVSKGGDTMTGKFTTVASATGTAGLNLPPGVAPSAPVNGDAWTTATALFVRINGTTLTVATDVDLALKAPLASPALTGTPTVPTAAPGTNTTQAASTAFVAALGGLKADLASPALTGTPTAPTASPGVSTTQLATTAFVAAADALKADLASPVFTGNPTAPTPTAGDNDTSIATTAFVTAAVSGGGSFLPITGGTLTGPLVMGTAQPIYQNGAAATDRVHGWQTGGVIRWAMYASSVAEGGANAGSDFGLNAYTDAGAYLSTPLSIKRSTGVVTFNSAPFFVGGVSGAQGGAFDIAKAASGTTLAGTAVRVDINANSLRIYENATPFRGCTLDLTGCGAQSAFWHSGNFNPASYQPALGYTPVRNYASSVNYLGWDGTGVALQTDSTFWGYVVYTAGGVASIPRVSCGVADGRGISCVGVGGTVSLTVFGEMTSGSYAASFIPMDAARGASSAFNFLRTRSATAGTADTEHNLRGDGACLSDVAAATPADYAELFEWTDGNPGGEMRVGLTVVLDGDKIRLSTPADDPRDILGAISAEPGFLGNSHWSRWQGKYLRDEYGRVRREWQDLVYWGRGEGQRRVKRREQLTKRDWDAFTEEDDVEEVRDFVKVLNPDFDPAQEYVPRSDRPEWDPVGLLGQIPVRDGQVTGDRWRKMRAMGPGVAMWMVR